ncbi:MAG: Exodeoxyribonuclease 7 large subunit [Candidatus Accumulibacter adjunctus]|uniref:Exodeoxyribonuclease 7 large subunit n=1 Tax=Candidatus Accumulibacter adjunctus TaxID=1454001 RepID=A0A011PSF7_9PROT|nr:MAG: Exodeoxyribonuclease 7 large subunit [Candidatus Accumulibacter adjunctus]
MEDFPSARATCDPPAAVIPVSLLNRLARERLEAAFPLCWVAGEVSNLSYAASGHVYFSLKDSAAQVRCVMFRNRAQLLGWRLENGQHIEARVLVTLYEARGDFQLNIEAARRAGQGNLYESFLRLKERLAREGLFDSALKRSLPAFPQRIGIVTSPQAAALRDVLSTLGRRAAHVGIVVYPTPVQGDGAAALIAAAIRTAGERDECDLLILCRGGGSLEDLQAFNDETVARAIRACPLPIVSGIGHETDFTIADFAADRRAATPTAAAEMAAPERSALLARLFADHLALRRQATQAFNQRAQQLDWLGRRLQHPGQSLARQREALHNLRRRLAAGLLLGSTRARGALASLEHRLHHHRPDLAPQRLRLQSLASQLERAGRQTLDGTAAELGRLHACLSQLDPRAVLARGYSIVTNGRQQIVHASSMLEPGEEIAVFLHDGRADAMVLAVSADDRGS